MEEPLGFKEVEWRFPGRFERYNELYGEEGIVRELGTDMYTLLYLKG